MMRSAVVGAAALVGIGLAAGVFSPPALALPGQCMSTPWGGFCDNPPAADGSFWHCEGAMGFSNCFQACYDPVANRPVPTDMNFNTPC